MKKVKIIILIIILFFLYQAFAYSRGISKQAGDESSDFDFVVESGQSVVTVAKNLKENNLIISEKYFIKYLKKEDLDAKLQAGIYILSPTLSIKEIARILTEGRVKDREKEIKLIEGWTIRDIAHYFEGRGMFQAEELTELAGLPMVDYRNSKIQIPKDYSEQFEFLKDKPKHYSLEGYLFPDTYKIFKDASLDDIVLKMLSNLDKKLTVKMREDINAQGKSVYEIITMASIIEKEVRSVEDMKIVSGIFWNRIKNGQALESCATLAYILGKNKPIYSLEDTAIDSPYNSYQNQGLPPGPISNPGIQAIEAAIYPTENDYNFFLSSSIDGKTVFSKTYQEHLTNKQKYLNP